MPQVVKPYAFQSLSIGVRSGPPIGIQ
jgi:hypothetical protein